MKNVLAGQVATFFLLFVSKQMQICKAEKNFRVAASKVYCELRPTHRLGGNYI